jgi:hypothetical protein
MPIDPSQRICSTISRAFVPSSPTSKPNGAVFSIASENLVVLRDGSLDLLHPEDLRRPIAVLDDGFH